MKHINVSSIEATFRIVLLWVAIMSAGCAGTEVGNPEACAPSTGTESTNYTLSPEVNTFKSNDELERYLKEQYANSVDIEALIAVDGPSDAPQASSEQTDGNVPGEQAASQSDLVITDDRYIYAAGDHAVHIVDIANGMRLLVSQPVGGNVSALFRHDDLLIVLYVPDDFTGRQWSDKIAPPDNARFGLPYWIPMQIRHGIAIFDVSDPGRPVKNKEVQFEGQLVAARLIDARLHLVQQFLPVLPPLEIRYDGTQSQRQAVVQSNRQLMAALCLPDMIPHYQVMTDAHDAMQPIVDAGNLYYPQTANGGGTITTVVNFDLASDDCPFAGVGMVADAHFIYTAAGALYIAGQKYLYGADVAEQATIYKFDLAGGDMRFAGGGRVPGWLLNQSALDDYQDVLRIATTTGHAAGWSPAASATHLFCLELNEDGLAIVGRLEDLIPGEQIRAVRFLNELGFAETATQTDPLITLDLSDPYAPEIVGELNVSGSSRYLHPAGGHHLITIGSEVMVQDTDAIDMGLQLCLFDVSDLSNPVRVYSEVIGDRGTDSEVLHNPKAFTFIEASNMLAIPIDLYEHQSTLPDPWSYGRHTFEGLYVYRLSTEFEYGFDLLGRIDTEEIDGYDAQSLWTKGIFADHMVYAVTEAAIWSVPVDDMEVPSNSLFY